MATPRSRARPAEPPLFLIRLRLRPELLKRSPKPSIPRLVVTRYEAISVDGTPSPMSRVGATGETAKRPVHLPAMGFVFRAAYYNSAVGKLWLEQGGTAWSAISGAGEFGRRGTSGRRGVSACR